VFRAPEATVASQLHEPPAWFDITDAPRSVQARFFPSIATVRDSRPVSTTALFAHAWRSAVEAARSVPAGRVTYLGYDALVDDPAATVRRLLTQWGRALADDATTRLAEVLATYSKDPQGSEPFDPDDLHHRPALSTEQQLEVDDVAGPRWRELQTAG
jgi:hypothetical protein